ncbi:exocyst subunit [Cryptotrichosporon argae]
MSRLPVSSSSKYKISQPQPYQDPAHSGQYANDFRQPAYRNGGPSSSAAQSAYPPSASYDDRQSSHGNPSNPNSATSPPRPARSVQRDQRDARDHRNLAPISTGGHGQPHAGYPQHRPLQNADHLGYQVYQQSAVSPVSPISAEGTTMTFADPFAADRNARSAARDQMAQAEARDTRDGPAVGGPATDRLRNVVGAFMSASQSRERGADRERATPKRAARKERERQEWKSDGTFAELDGVMRRIDHDWPFILDGEFSPSSLALKLLDSPRLPAFLDLQASLSSALQSAVQAHFQTFAASLPAHANFLATLGRAQQQVQTSRQALREAREGFGGKAKTELASVRARERVVKEMLQILDVIDELKQVPDQLESLIGEKRFLQAALILVKSIKTINRDDLKDIGAVSELRQYFASQEGTLTDILVEELHNHLYLKTFYSDSHWRAFTPGQEYLPELDQRFTNYLSALAVKPNSDPSLDVSVTRTMGQAGSSSSLAAIAMSAPDSTGGNPEADTYTYIETLLEALATLGRLGPALEALVQRVPGEIHALVEATLDEVEERSDSWSEDLSVRPEIQLFRSGDMLRLAVSLDAMGPPKHAIILRDLFWTLYSKFVAVMEGHRVVYEVARWISSRRISSLNIPVLEIWKPVQNEVRTLLHTYLDDVQGSALERHALMSINEILRDGKVARDKQKAMFKFSETDARAVSNDIKGIDEALKLRLKASVPGLVSLQVNDAVVAEDRSAKHRTLIPPNPFNVTVMFQPSLAFIERAIAIVPPGFEDETSQFANVLEDFVVKVFLPQLDERVTASFQQAVSDADTIDPSFDKPPLRSSVRTMSLIHNLCGMLQTTPFHRENYSRLIVGVIVQYYQHCSGRFRDLTARGEDMSLPAVWAQREDIIKCLTDVRAILPSDPEAMPLFQQEIKLETSLLGDRPVVESQLISSARRFESLGHVAQSLRWFIDALLDLQEAGPSSFDHPRLPLTRAMAQRYEAIIQTYEQLVEMVLNTMRLEIRCRVLCNLGASLRKGDYRLESEALEPDPDIVDLNESLTGYEEIAAQTLGDTDKEFIFRGLGKLVDHIFIHGARGIKMVNLAGINKIKRNIWSVQQLLRSLVARPDALDRSFAYWDLYAQGPRAMLDGLREGAPAFAFEDYNIMLNLQCKTDQADAPSSELNTYLIDLHALSMSIEGWDE